MYKIVPLLFISWFCNAQKQDTLYVSHDKTLYTLFSADIDHVNIGSFDFEYEFTKNMVMIKAINPKAPTTSMMVKTKSGDVFVWYLAYQLHPKSLLVDTRPTANDKTINTNQKSQVSLSASSRHSPEKSYTTNSGSAMSPSNNAAIERERKLYSSVKVPYFIKEREEAENRDYETTDELLQQKMFYILNQKRFIRDIGERDNSIYFMLFDLYVDKKYIYLKLSIHNTSSIAFDIDFMSFERMQGKTFKNREGTSIQPLDVLYKESVKSVIPYKEEIIVYVIPLFAFEDKDAILVKLSELGGVRTMKFSVPAKLITNAKYL